MLPSDTQISERLSVNNAAGALALTALHNASPIELPGVTSCKRHVWSQVTDTRMPHDLQ